LHPDSGQPYPAARGPNNVSRAALDFGSETGEKSKSPRFVKPKPIIRRRVARKSYGSELVRISIIQSCYIPWKGFFDLIGQCDEYVIYDSAQYVKRHWHNRNRIKTATGVQWLTIPVLTGGRFEQSIETVEIEKPWADKHWRTLELAYKGAPFFQQVAPTVKGWYERAENQKRLTDVNAIFTEGITKFLGLKTRISRDTAYPSEGAKTERLLGIALAAGADRYLSGPSARAYFDEQMFAAAGITPEWMSYEGYPEYAQLHGAFEHAVTTLDVLFNAAPDAPRLIQRVNERKQPGHN
jgi:WbqC-like protein